MPSALAMAYFLTLMAGAIISCVYGRKSERVVMGLVLPEWAMTYPTWLWATSTGHGVTYSADGFGKGLAGGRFLARKH